MVEIKKLVTDFDKDNTPYWFNIDGKDYLIAWNWSDEYVNLDTMQYYHETDRNHKPLDGFHNLNDLYNMGHKVKHVYPFEEVDYYPEKEYPRSIAYTKVQKFFKEHGFNVTKEAILHQFNAWKADYKSGYRDELNGYHLFTPCGHNPFTIRLSKLHHTADWQKTYTC